MTLVHLTDADIMRGAACDSRRCPVALALYRMVNYSTYFEVLSDGIEITTRVPVLIVEGWKGKTHALVCYSTAYVPMPDDMKNDIADFDDHKFIAPAVYEIDLPEWALR